MINYECNVSKNLRLGLLYYNYFVNEIYDHDYDYSIFVINYDYSKPSGNAKVHFNSISNFHKKILKFLKNFWVC